MKKRIRFALMIFGLAVPLLSQNVTKVGTTAAKFLSIPVGARATGMGTAFVALANDATAAYWNPGALNMIEKTEIQVSHAEWFGGLSFDFGAVVVPLGLDGDFGALGVSYTMMSMPEERVTTVDDPEGEFSGTFDAGSYALGLSYSKRLTDRFSIGGTIKYISERIYNSEAVGMAFDIGTIYQTPFKGLTLGVSITNFGQKMQISGEDLIVQKDIDPSIGGNNESINAMLMTDEFDLPLNMRIGVAYTVMNTDFNRLTVLADAMHPNDVNESVSLGAEYAVLNEMVMLRGGYKNLFLNDREGSFTFGLGLHIKTEMTDIDINYAFSEFEHLQDVHLFSLGFKL